MYQGIIGAFRRLADGFMKRVCVERSRGGSNATACGRRVEERPLPDRGVGPDAVAPGVIDTGMTRPLLDIPGVKDSLDMIPIPRGRWGKPEEIAGAIAFLLSGDSSYVVGQVLFVDGGTDALLQPMAYPHPLPGGR